MNQPITPVVAPKAVAVENLDIMTMVRRYAWLLIAGAVVGAAVSGGLFFGLLKVEPRYTARIPFQVLPQPPSIGQTDRMSIIMNQEEASQLINRQVFIFDQEQILLDILKTDAFLMPDRNDPTRTSDWVRRNGKVDTKQLRKDLVVVPKINAASFEITMTAKFPVEAAQQAKAAADYYEEFLRTESKARQNLSLEQMGDALRKAENDFTFQSELVAQEARLKGIDVMRSKFEVERALLQGINADWVKADAEAVQAEAQLGAILELTKEGTEVKLTPEMEQWVERDPILMGLQNTRLSWEQERAAAERNLATSSTARLKEIEARLEKVDQQIKENRERLRAEAQVRMIEQARNMASSLRTVAAHIGELKSDKEQLVRTLGQDLMSYQQKVDDLKEKQDLLNKLRAEYTFADLNRATDMTRVNRLLRDPAVPLEVSWPRWYMFIPAGTLAGLGLAAAMAYLLMLTDTRVRTPRDISRTLQLPTLGFVPDEGDDRTLTGSVETAIVSSPGSMVAESFRQIRSQITAQTAHNPVNTLLVASITPGGGSTTVACNLAAAMALNDLRVLLVDANFYRPGLGRVFKGIPAEGIAEVARDPKAVMSAITPHQSLPKLHLLSAGSELQGVSAELFESKAFRELLDELKSRYDLIIFDGAPLNLVSDSLSLASRVDGVVTVVRAGEVSRGAVVRTRDQLRGVHASLVGFVLNAAQTSSTGYFKENYRSFYRYARTRPKERR